MAEDDEFRSDPRMLLDALKAEEAGAGRGRLKIFLGMAPGVGKTCAMLAAAREEMRKGRRVLVGVVETHGREETARLADGLPVLPLKKIRRGGAELREFNLEAALAERPALVLLDELAHENAPGSRHPKRWLDAEDLLAAGIDVFTTLNVQHVESRADSVAEITGAKVRETVPDSVLSGADSVQLVDLAPAELRRRLAEGKVYAGGNAETAAANFFRETNLLALREIALRLAAERADNELSAARRLSGERKIWKSAVRLMVAVGPSPFSRRLVRRTRRLAYALSAPWIALSVDTGTPLAEDARRRLDENLELARELGAEVVVEPGSDVAESLLRTARLRNVTLIVVGKSGRFGFFPSESLVDRIVRGSGEIDVFIVPADARDARRGGVFSWRRNETWSPRETLRECAAGSAAVAALSAVGLLAAPYLGSVVPALLYLAGISVLGTMIGRLPIFLTAAASALCWNALFLEPRGTLVIREPQDALMFALFFVMAIAMGRVTTRLRAKEREERRRDLRSQTLLLVSRAIASAKSFSEVPAAATECLRKLTGARCAVFAGLRGRGLSLLETPARAETAPEERAVAEWCVENGASAGRFTDSFPESRLSFFPLRSEDGRVHGCIAFELSERRALPASLRNLFETAAATLAQAFAAEDLARERERARLLRESDDLYRALLDSVSHEFKTPLAVINGLGERLAETAAAGTPLAETAEEIRSASRRLLRLVCNLLDMTRLQSGRVRPSREAFDLGDIVSAAFDATERERAAHPAQVEIPPDAPLVETDFSLAEQIFVNLIRNVEAHTPAGTRIRISAVPEPEKSRMAVVFADDGPGIPAALREAVFERFRQGNPRRSGGLGLGLSIAKGFAEACGGGLGLFEPPDGRGAAFLLTFPLAK